MSIVIIRCWWGRGLPGSPGVWMVAAWSGITSASQSAAMRPGWVENTAGSADPGPEWSRQGSCAIDRRPAESL